MRGVVFRGEREVEVISVDDPTPKIGDVVIEVRASGMCGTDLHRYRGSRESARAEIVGHEPAGVVMAVGAGVSHELLGVSVMVHHYIGCSRCDQCRQGWTQLCRARARVLGHDADGSHADYMLVPASTLVPMPEGLTFSAAAAISCGTGTAWGALERLSLKPEDTIAIFGQGPVGAAATQLSVAHGARVIALDIKPERLKRARTLGAAEVLDASSGSVVDAIRELTQGRGVSKALETSGSSTAANQMLQILDTWGAACYVGVGSTLQFDVAPLLERQITVMTSWTMSIVAQEKCARFVIDHQVDVDAIFTDSWGLSDAAAAYRHFDLQTAGKGVLMPGSRARDQRPADR